MAQNPALEKLLQQGELKPLIEQALKIQQVNQALQPLLPEAFRGEVQVATIKSGSVLLDVPNAAMLTLLRYQGPELLSQLRQVPGLGGLASVKFRVAPRHCEEEYPRNENANEFKRISTKTATLLRETAEKLSDDDLKAALLHLATKI